MSEHPFVIKGGAGEYHAAAVAAVVQHVLDSEATALGLLPPPNIQHAWARVLRPGPIGRFNPPIVPDPGMNWPR